MPMQSELNGEIQGPAMPDETWKLGPLISATMKQENDIISQFKNPYTGVDNAPAPGFNLAKELQDRKMEDEFDNLSWVNNRQRLDIEIGRVQRERKNREIIAAAPWWAALPAGVFAGMASPTLLLPGGAVVRSAKGGYSVLSTAANVGAWAGAGTLIQEAMLQHSQLTRDKAESAVNVGSGIILGGFLGAGAAAVMSRAEKAVAGRVIREAFDTDVAREVKAQETRVMPEADVKSYRERWAEAGLPETEFDRWKKLVEWKKADEVENDFLHVAQGDRTIAFKDLEEEAAIVGRIERGGFDFPTFRGTLDTMHGFNDRPYVQTRDLADEDKQQLLDIANERQAQWGEPPYKTFEEADAAGDINRFHIEGVMQRDPSYQKEFAQGFDGSRYGGVFGDENTVYLDGDGKWIGGRAPGMEFKEAIKVAAEFDNALVLSPASYERILERVKAERGQATGVDIADWAKAKGYDGLIVTGMDKEAVRLGGAAEAVDARFGHDSAMWQDQVVSFNPERLRPGEAVPVGRAAPAGTVADQLAILLNPKVDQSADVRPAAAGAQAVERRSWQELREAYGIRGAATNALSKVGRSIFPGLRLSHSPFPAAREIFNKMVGSNLHLNEAGTAPGGSAFDQMRVEYSRLYNEGLRQQFRNYADMKRKGVNMDWGDYDRAVGEAMRTGDTGANEFVSKGAKIWRDTAILPMRKLAEATGSLSMEDVAKALANAESYFPRSHIRDAFIRHRNVAEQRLMPHAMAALEGAYSAQSEKLAGQLAKIDKQIVFLGLDRAGKERMLLDLDAQLDELDKAFPLEASIYDRIEEVKEALKNKGLSNEVKTQLKNERDELRARLKGTDFETKQRALQYEQKLTEQSIGAAEDKAGKLIEQLEKLADDQLRQTHRLIAKGQQFQREKARLAPEVWEKKRAELKASFEEREAGYANAITKLEDQEYKLELERKALEDRIEEAKVAQDGREVSNFELIKAAQVELAKFNENIKPVLKRIAQEKKRVENARLAMDRVNRRLDAAEQFDNDGIMEAFRIATAELEQDLANSMMIRGMRAQRKLDQLEKVGPDVVAAKIEDLRGRKANMQAVFDRKWMPNYEKTPPFKGWADDMVRSYIDAVTGIEHDKVEPIGEYSWPTKVGPLKGRANWFPESALTQPIPGTDHGFLKNDASHVLNHYLRVMAGDVAMRRTFDEISLENTLAKLTQQFDQMNDAIGRATTVDQLKEIAGDTGIRYSKDVEVSRRRAYDFLSVQFAKNQDDLRAMRDRVLGRYKVAENSSDAGRAFRALNQINYIRLMGGVVLSSLTEAIRPAMVHGLRPFLEHIVQPMISDIEALKLGAEDARLAGLVGEMVGLHRLHDMAEIADPLAKGTMLERALDNMVSVGTRWNGLAAWTDIQQAQAAIMTQGRIIKAIQSGKEKDYLRFLGIDEGYASIIEQQFRKHGEVRSGVYISNADRWTEGLSDAEAGRIENARMAYWSALRKEVDSIIVMQSPGDTPLFASTPLGKSVLQFRAYNMSAHQKVMLRGLQEGPQRFMSGLIPMAIGGMAVAALQARAGGTDRWEKFKQSASNPGFLLGEGLDKSGLFPLLMDVGQTVDQVARAGGKSFNPVKTPMLMPFPQESQAGDQTRWASGQGAWSLLGPGASFLMKELPAALGNTAKQVTGNELSESERKAQIRAMLYGNYPGLNYLLRNLYIED